MNIRKAKTTTEVLIATKWILENVGWTQGLSKRYDADDKLVGMCLNEALYQVETEGPDLLNKAYRIVMKMTEQTFIIPWNDKPGRTKEEVLDLLDRAIKR